MSDQTSNGIYVRTPLPDVTVEEAYGHVEDPSYWDDTMAPILHHFNLSLGDYGKLTVYQHRLLFEYLVGRGLADAI